MGQKTKQAIINELQNAKYFSVIVDSTPDLSHVDQLTFIFQFVNQTGHVVERFLGFEPISASTHRWGTVFGDSNVRINLTLKSLSTTRWSCCADSTKALWENYQNIQERLRTLSTDDTEKRDTL